MVGYVKLSRQQLQTIGYSSQSTRFGTIMCFPDCFYSERCNVLNASWLVTWLVAFKHIEVADVRLHWKNFLNKIQKEVLIVMRTEMFSWEDWDVLLKMWGRDRKMPRCFVNMGFMASACCSRQSYDSLCDLSLDIRMSYLSWLQDAKPQIYPLDGAPNSGVWREYLPLSQLGVTGCQRKPTLSWMLRTQSCSFERNRWLFLFSEIRLRWR